MISIVVPTYREADNLPLLAKAIDETFADLDRDYELLFVDDNSQDGSEEICAKLSETLPVRIIVRKGTRGLATAVLHGISLCSGEIIVVMDADLSHPSDAIPAMLERLQSGESDFVLGSRHVRGGSIHEDWSAIRRLGSAIASLLAKPLSSLEDPMSGFFALRRADMPDPSGLRPIGYKIALELLVKGDFHHPSEVPIHFASRRHGDSKLSLAEHWRFLRHLRRLYAFKLHTRRAR